MDLESALIQLFDKEQDHIDPEEITEIKLGDTPINGKDDLKDVFISIIELINRIIKCLDIVEIDSLDIAEYCMEIINLQAGLQNIVFMLEEEPQVIRTLQE